MEGPSVPSLGGPWDQFWSLVSGTEQGQSSGPRPTHQRPFLGALSANLSSCPDPEIARGISSLASDSAHQAPECGVVGGEPGSQKALLGLHQPCSFPEDSLSPLSGQGTRCPRDTHPTVCQWAAGRASQKKGMVHWAWALE